MGLDGAAHCGQTETMTKLCTFIGAACLLNERVGGGEEFRDILGVYVCQLQAQVLKFGRQLHVLRVVVDCDHPAMTPTMFIPS